MPKQQLAPTSGPLLPLSSPGSIRQVRSNGSHVSRYNNHHQQHQASPQRRIGGAGAVEIPLPLPKNQVMMALMELSSFTLKDQKETNLVDESDSASGSSEGYEDEDALVFDGIESLGGQCGTYVVRERKGVMVQLHHPHHKTLGVEKENVENVRDSNREGRHDVIWRMDSSASFLTAKSNNEIEHSTSFSQPTIVGYGQKVQIVDRVDGVFRLPRNRGFIVANDSQLVKVGAPLEQCCKLEGILSSFSAAKLDLQRKLEQISKDEFNLNRQLKKQSALPEAHPIISEPLPDNQTNRDNSNNSSNSYHNPYEDDRNDFDMTPSCRLSPSLPNINVHSSYESGSVVSPTPISPPTNRSSVAPMTPIDMFQLSDDEEDHDNGEMNWRIHAISVVDSLPDPINGDNDESRPLSPFRRGIICGSSLFPRLGLRSALSGESADSVCSGGAVSAGPCGVGSIYSGGDENSGDRGIEMSYSVPAPGRTWSTRSWTGDVPGRGENDSPYVNGALNTVLSNTSIDFRTGMSGHMGLGSAVKDGRRPFSTCRGETRMMSEHRGIGSIRPIRKIGSPRHDSNKK